MGAKYQLRGSNLLPAPRYSSFRLPLSLFATIHLLYFDINVKTEVNKIIVSKFEMNKIIDNIYMFYFNNWISFMLKSNIGSKRNDRWHL